MKEKVIITDVTRMKEPRVCVAGYLERSCECVRPIFSRFGPTEEWLSVEGQVVIRPFAIVELDLRQKKDSPPHTEDWIVDSSYRASRGMLTPSEQDTFLTKIEDRSVGTTFGTKINRETGFEHLSGYVKVGEGKRSLGTIRPKMLSQVFYREKREREDKLDYRIAFTDQTGEEYRLAVTDLAFRRYLDHMSLRESKSLEKTAQLMTATLRESRMFLRIGLARPWNDYPDRCYLQITGVYSFPDYLDGRCFADFLSERK
jgi:hypothetical protein